MIYLHHALVSLWFWIFIEISLMSPRQYRICRLPFVAIWIRMVSISTHRISPVWALIWISSQTADSRQQPAACGQSGFWTVACRTAAFLCAFQENGGKCETSAKRKSSANGKTIFTLARDSPFALPVCLKNANNYVWSSGYLFLITHASCWAKSVVPRVTFFSWLYRLCFRHCDSKPFKKSEIVLEIKIIAMSGAQKGRGWGWGWEWFGFQVTGMIEWGKKSKPKRIQRVSKKLSEGWRRTKARGPGSWATLVD